MIPATVALLAALGRARFAVHPAARRERSGEFGEVPGGGYKPRGAAAQSAAPLSVFVQPFVARAPSPVLASEARLRPCSRFKASLAVGAFRRKASSRGPLGLR